jgi:hypothetical protein
MLQMADNQFNTLVRSYRDNYIQHRVTGDMKFQKSYSGAEKGIQNIICGLQKKVDDQTKSIDTLYSSKLDDSVKKLQGEQETLQYGIVKEHDLKKAAEERQSELSTTMPTPAPSMTGYYITIGALVIAIAVSQLV